MKSPHLTHALGAPINGLAWHESTLAAACGDGTLHLARPGLEKVARIEVTESPLLAVITIPEGFATASESGDIHIVTPEGNAHRLAATRSMFLEHILYFPKKKQLLAATGKTVTAVNMDGTTTVLPHKTPSTIAGMALSPIGPRLAVSHYGGATIMPLDTPSNPPRLLPWKGSHLALTYSPDGKWLISAMQEQAIHLWRLSDSLDLQMRGYPTKITQFSWDSTGTTLGTNGGGGVPLWDFSTVKGPAGTSAKVIADSGSQETTVSSLAMHPKGPFCAIGYTDGLTLLTNTAEDRAILLHEPAEFPTTHLAWSSTGMHLGTAVNESLTVTDFAALV